MISTKDSARNNLLQALKLVVQALKRRDRKEPGWKEKEKAEEELAAVFQPAFDRMARLIRARLVELDKKRPNEPEKSLMHWSRYWSKDGLLEFTLKLLPTDIFNGLDITDDEADRIRNELFNTVYNGAGLFQDETGYILDVGLINKEAQSWAAAYSSELITKIDDVTRQVVRETISDFVATPGMTIADAMGRMPFDPQRAQTIAVTEITRSYAQGNQIAGEVMKEQFPDVAVVKVWFTNNDDLVCDICGPLNGVEVGLNDSWDSDEGDLDNPPAHPNCRCWTQTTTNILAGEQPVPGPAPAPAPVPIPAPAPAPIVEPKPARAPRAPKWAPGDTVPKFKSNKEAEVWARKNKFAKIVNFGKMELGATQEYLESIARNYTAMPKLQGRLKFLGSAQARVTELQKLILKEKEWQIRQYPNIFGHNLTEAQIRTLAEEQMNRYPWHAQLSDNAYAISFGGYQWEGMTSVTLNERFAANYDDMLKELKRLRRDVLNSWSPIGGDTVTYVMDHEMGHQIDNLLDLTRNYKTIHDPDLRKIYNGAKKSTGGIAEALCRYAETDAGEFIAEAWAEYLNNPAPRKIAREVGERITALYAEKYP